MKTASIGFELELTGITREQAAEAVASTLGGTVRRTYGSYDTYEVKAPDQRVWRLVSDSSILTRKRVNGQLVAADSTYSVELVSPILAYADIETLQEVVRSLRKAGGVSQSNLQCGCHLHIGASNHTAKTLRNFFNLFASKEDLIYKSFEVDPSRERYCKRINPAFLEALNKQKPTTMEAFANLWYKDYDAHESRNRKYHSSRYSAANAHSIFGVNNTLEIRIQNGLLHAGKIRAFIILFLAMNHQALTQKSASQKRTFTENEAYSFRNFLVRMGLSGEEFKHCRQHLMANMPGDSAFKDASRRMAA